MSHKTKVSSVRLPLELLNQAKERGLNLSQILTEALTQRLNCSTPVVQTSQNPGTPPAEREKYMKSNINSQLRWPSWLGHRLGKAEVLVSEEDIPWDEFGAWLMNQGCSERTMKERISYSRNYLEVLKDLSTLGHHSPSKRDHIRKGLIALSKFLGFYAQLKQALKNSGIKWTRTSSVDSFLRIMGASKGEDLLEWLKKARGCIGKPSLSLLLKFMALTGLRKAEAINSFNLIIALSQERGGPEGYYDPEKGALEHYKYPDTFLRTTKNVFFSLVPEELLDEIAGCEPVTYAMVRKRLERRGMNVRINELRDHWGTFLLDHGLIKEEIDLLQGRVGKSIFVRHYWSPALLELKDRVFKALEILEPKL